VAKTFRPWNLTQSWLLPPSINELVPAEHPAHFVRDTVRDLDLSEILDCYQEERGFPPFHPVMMTALLLYAYAHGVFSSRRIARGCEERVDFMAVTGMQRPDFRTVAKFRKRHLQALRNLFGQIVVLCQTAGLVRLGHVALDGTKLAANASKRKAMSYKRMKQSSSELKAKIDSWFERAEAEDAAEDAEFADRRGDELPTWVANAEQRRAKIREAMAALEAEAKAAADDQDDDDDPPPATGSDDDALPLAKPKRMADGTPHDKAQRNFTDPESRILKTSDGYVQGYNAQIAVCAHAQVIVAHGLSNQQNDVAYLPVMVRRIKATTGRQARELSADFGYLSEDNLATLARHHIRGYVAVGRHDHGAAGPQPKKRWAGRRTRAMRVKLARAGYRSRYRLRKQVVEPVFGQIKAAMGFTRFLLRGLNSVRHEWALVATAHNLRKLIAAS
jgi:transposase